MERVDECIPIIRNVLRSTKFKLVSEDIIDDNPDRIEVVLRQQIAQDISLILTSGGTGCGDRDFTPEVTTRVIDRLTPGIDEAIRSFSITKSAYAMYSRAVSGIASRSLVISLPGSPKAVAEILEFLLPTLHHPLNLIAKAIKDCKEDIES
jgi:molybdenum cofactor synthesis domain-containing protein